MKLYIRLLFLIIGITGILSPINAQNSKDIPCFVYHRFGESRYASTNISLEAFEAQMDWLKQNEYTVFTLGEALKMLKTGQGVPEKSVILTIDDAFGSFESGAMPILRKYGFKATLFVNTQQIGKRSYLDWKSLKKLKKEGIEIGNHSHSHEYFLNLLPSVRISTFKADVQHAQELFQNNMEFTPTLFAFPYGEYSLEMKAAVKEMGFEAAAAQHSGVIHEKSDLYSLPRFPMGGPYATLTGFKSKAKMKALLISSKQESPLLSDQNPPVFSFQILSKDINIKQVQCFVAGTTTCNLKQNAPSSGQFTLKSQTPLKNRRTLYTITAPSKDGKSWHWFSHIWIKTD